MPHLLRIRNGNKYAIPKQITLGGAVAIATLTASVFAQPTREDTDGMMRAATLRAATDLPDVIKLAKAAVEDSSLTPEKIKSLQKSIDTEAKNLEKRYQPVKAGGVVDEQLANPLMLITKVIHDSAGDPFVAREISMQMVMESQLVLAPAMMPEEPTAATKRLIPLAQPSPEQQAKIDHLLAALEKDVNAERAKHSQARTLPKEGALPNNCRRL